MGGELLAEAPLPQRVKTYAEQFHEVFPYYLSIGMPYDLFWLGDSTLVRAYRKAYELNRKRANYDAWLQGAYLYDALCMVSPLLHAFAQKGTKPAPYHKLPYGEKVEVDPEIARAEFLAKWKANKAKWKSPNSKADVNERRPAENGGGVNGDDD